MGLRRKPPQCPDMAEVGPGGVAPGYWNPL
jgi:hypothetical protein